MLSSILTINLRKIKHNARMVVNWCQSWGIAVYGVTKVVCGDPLVARAMLAGGCTGLADSRWENLCRLCQAGISSPLMLIRAPGLSDAAATVKYADMTLVTESLTLRALSRAAVKLATCHRVLPMIEVGDLREGKSPKDVVRLAVMTESLPGLSVAGVGANWGCFAGAVPDAKSQALVEETISMIEYALGRKLAIVSGGNSSTLPWLRQQRGWPAINQLRIGETIMLGKDPLSDKIYTELYSDAFVLSAEVIEVGEKRVVSGDSSNGGQETVRCQALVDVGIQDIGAGHLIPWEQKGYRVLGMTSDHLVLEILPLYLSPDRRELKVGDRVEFIPDYEALLGLMTSPYVEKSYKADALA